MLLTVSPFEIELSPKQRTSQWASFMRGEEMRHSAQGATLAWLIRRAEHQKVAYRLEAHPGVGYAIQKIQHVNSPAIVRKTSHVAGIK